MTIIKTLQIPITSDLYARLDRIAKRRGLRGVRALVLQLFEGIVALEGKSDDVAEQTEGGAS